MNSGVFVFAAAVAATSLASACPPPMNPIPFEQTVAEAYHAASAVFEATVVRVERSPKPEPGGTLHTNLKPARSHKGTPQADSLAFSIVLTGTTCDQWPNYGVNSRLLVFSGGLAGRPLLVVPSEQASPYQLAIAQVRKLSAARKP